MDAILEVREASIRFGDFTAVERLTLSVRPGEVFGLIGPNGSGKTSLIRALCGLVPLTEGSARVLGRDVARDAARVRSQIGYMSQKFGLYHDLTARENIAFYAGIYGLPAAQARSRQQELIRRTGLGPYLDRRTGLLSGGWKQRVALVCALLHEPQLVFLDEPTAGIDPLARRELWDLLSELAAEGLTLFVTTHYMDEAERCTRVGYLYLGHLLAVGTQAELKQLPEVTPPGTQRLEISSADNVGLLAELRRRSGVREAMLFGDALRSVVDAARRPTDLGLGSAAVRAVEPTLEDVFVSLARSRI
jgi:ABC-2 type transport system ATP-binding protein